MDNPFTDVPDELWLIFCLLGFVLRFEDFGVILKLALDFMVEKNLYAIAFLTCYTNDASLY